LGKLDDAGGVAGLRAAIQQQGGQEIMIRTEHVLKVSALPWHHRDPFDRMLVAQSAVEQLTLVTADAQIKRYDGAVL
jgi:PIN domain nuclease of toxin-antitoxin system